MWGVLLLACSLKMKMNSFKFPPHGSFFFFAPVKDDKNLTDIILSKVGCSNYVSTLN